MVNPFSNQSMSAHPHGALSAAYTTHASMGKSVISGGSPENVWSAQNIPALQRDTLYPTNFVHMPPRYDATVGGGTNKNPAAEAGGGNYPQPCETAKYPDDDVARGTQADTTSSKTVRPWAPARNSPRKEAKLSPLEWARIFDEHLDKNARGNIQIDTRDLKRWSHIKEFKACLEDPESLKTILTNASKGLKKCRPHSNLHVIDEMMEYKVFNGDEDLQDPLEDFIEKLGQMVTVEGVVTMVGPIETKARYSKRVCNYCEHVGDAGEPMDAMDRCSCANQGNESVGSLEDGQKLEITLAEAKSGGVIPICTTVRGLAGFSFPKLGH